MKHEHYGNFGVVADTAMMGIAVPGRGARALYFHLRLTMVLKAR
jgi:hypothetical protein